VKASHPPLSQHQSMAANDTAHIKLASGMTIITQTMLKTYASFSIVT
jgi:hypothetical protein